MRRDREVKIYDISKWIFENDDDSLHALRKQMGLPPVTWKDVACKRCQITMRAQFNGTTRIDYFCHYCRCFITRQADEWI